MITQRRTKFPSRKPKRSLAQILWARPLVLTELLRAQKLSCSREITSNLTHAGLGNDKTQWAGIYDTLFRKTGIRDTSGWHSIALGTRTVDGAGNIVYEIVQGTSQIGTKASSTIIKY